MSEIKAFPVPSNANAWGMSLRDYFAAAALTGMNASMPESKDFPKGDLPGRMAASAYLQADAMLKAREAKP